MRWIFFEAESKSVQVGPIEVVTHPIRLAFNPNPTFHSPTLEFVQRLESAQHDGIEIDENGSRAYVRKCVTIYKSSGSAKLRLLKLIHTGYPYWSVEPQYLTLHQPVPLDGNRVLPDEEREIQLPGIATVRDLLCQISEATKRQYSADYRLGQRSIDFGKDTVTVSETIQALAVGLHASMREVHGRFHLTSQVQGLAAIGYQETSKIDGHYMRVNREVAKISDFLSTQQWVSDCPWIGFELNEPGEYQAAEVPAAILRRFPDLEGSDIKLDVERAIFIQTCNGDWFRTRVTIQPLSNDADWKPKMRPPLFCPVHSEEDLQALKDVESNEWVIETRSVELLRKSIELAKRHQKPIYLAARPWHFQTEDPDMNYCGEAAETGHPLSKERPEHWRLLYELSQTKGLEGVKVLNERLRGYETGRSRGRFVGGFGYHLQNRLDFMEHFEVDPIDLYPGPAPFFDGYDEELREKCSAWKDKLGAQYKEAMKSFPLPM